MIKTINNSTIVVSVSTTYIRQLIKLYKFNGYLPQAEVEKDDSLRHLI